MPTDLLASPTYLEKTGDLNPLRTTPPELGGAIPGETEAWNAYNELARAKNQNLNLKPEIKTALQTTLRTYRDTAKALGRDYFPTQRAPQIAAREQHFQNLLSGTDQLSKHLDPSTYTQLEARAKTAPDPQAYKARTVLQTILSTAYGKPIKPEAWDSLRDTYAKQQLKLEGDTSDTAVYNALAAKYKQRKDYDQILQDHATSAIEQLMSGTYDPKTATATLASITKDADNQPNLLAEYKLRTREATYKLRHLAPITDALWNHLAITADRPELTKDATTKIPENAIQAAERLASLPPDLQDTVLQTLHHRLQKENLTPTDQRTLLHRLHTAIGNTVLQTGQGIADSKTALDTLTQKQKWAPGTTLDDTTFRLMTRLNTMSADLGTLVKPSDHWTSQSLILATEQAPYMLLASSGIGALALGASMAGQSYANQRLTQPDTNTTLQAATAITSGAGQAAIERFATKALGKALMGKSILPAALSGRIGTEGLLRAANITDKLTRGIAAAGIAATKIAGTELLEEAAQDTLDTELTDLATTLSGGTGTHNIADTLKSYLPHGTGGKKLLLSILPLALIGAGASGFTHYTNGTTLAKNKALLSTFLPDDIVKQIVTSPDVATAETIIQQAFQTEGVVQARQDKISIAIERLEAAEKLAEQEGFTITAYDHELKQYALHTPGAAPQMFDTYEAAATAYAEQAQDLYLDRWEAWAEQSGDTALAHLTDEGQANATNIKIEEHDFTGTFHNLIKKGLATQEMLEARAVIFAADHGITTAEAKTELKRGALTIKAANFRNSLKRGAYNWILQKFKHADALNITEDYSEIYWKATEENGYFTKPELIKNIRELEALTETPYLPADFDHTDPSDANTMALWEALAKASIRTALALRHHPSLDTKFRDWIQNMIFTQGDMWTWAKDFAKSAPITDILQNQTLNKKFLNALQDSVGLNDQARQNRILAQEQAAMQAALEEDAPRLSQAAKRLLPHPQTLRERGDSNYGEIQNIYNSLVRETKRRNKRGEKIETKTAAETFFLPKGKYISLDDIRQDLTAQGYPGMDTVSDMLDMITDAVFHGREHYATHAGLQADQHRQGHLTSYSLTPANDNAALANQDGGNQVAASARNGNTDGDINMNPINLTSKEIISLDDSIDSFIKELPLVDRKIADWQNKHIHATEKIRKELESFSNKKIKKLPESEKDAANERKIALQHKLALAEEEAKNAPPKPTRPESPVINHPDAYAERIQFTNTGKEIYHINTEMALKALSSFAEKNNIKYSTDNSKQSESKYFFLYNQQGNSSKIRLSNHYQPGQTMGHLGQSEEDHLASLLKKEAGNREGEYRPVALALYQSLIELGYDKNTAADLASSLQIQQPSYSLTPDQRTALKSQGITPDPSAQAYPTTDGKTLITGGVSFSLSVEDYGITHRPNDDGPRAHNLNEEEMTPGDVYEHPEWYSGMGKKVIAETMKQLRAVKGKADALLTIYRAGPKGEINKGDWVSLSKTYASTHAESQNPENYKVWESKVKAIDVRWALDDLAEFGYFGENTNATESNISFSLTAYHGTPHKVNQFSTEKIGTGEGAQAYGYGLYFAQNKSVAKQYTYIHPEFTKLRSASFPSDRAAWVAGQILANNPIEDIKDGISILDADITPEQTKSLIQQGRERIAKAEAAANLYTVTLNIEDDELLDWDKPISEQSEKVKSVIENLLAKDDVWQTWKTNGTHAAGKANKGASAYTQLAGGKGITKSTTEDQKTASAALLAAGIKGIRYLDGNSRNNQFSVRGAGDYHSVINSTNGQKTAEFEGPHSYDQAIEKAAELNNKGSYNYVIFDEKDITITHENGSPLTTNPSYSLTPSDTNNINVTNENGNTVSSVTVPIPFGNNDVNVVSIRSDDEAADVSPRGNTQGNISFSISRQQEIYEKAEKNITLYQRALTEAEKALNQGGGVPSYGAPWSPLNKELIDQIKESYTRPKPGEEFMYNEKPAKVSEDGSRVIYGPGKYQNDPVEWIDSRLITQTLIKKLKELIIESEVDLYLASLEYDPLNAANPNDPSADPSPIALITAHDREIAKRMATFAALLDARDENAKNASKTFVAHTWLTYAKYDEIFQFGRTNSKNASDIAAAVSSPGKLVTAAESTESIRFISHNGTLDIMDTDTPRPYIRAVNANSKGKKEGGGSQLYAAALDWIHNNGKIIKDDPAGITGINMIRRTSNFLASAIRWGTTKHLRPHADQRVGKWSKINNINIALLATKEMSNVHQSIPSSKLLTYDFTNDKFISGEKEFTAETLQKLIEENKSFDKGIGISTLQRAIITASAIQEFQRGSTANIVPEAPPINLTGVSYSLTPSEQLPEVDQVRKVKDGLKINGSLYNFRNPAPSDLAIAAAVKLANKSTDWKAGTFANTLSYAGLPHSIFQEVPWLDDYQQELRRLDQQTRATTEQQNKQETASIEQLFHASIKDVIQTIKPEISSYYLAKGKPEVKHILYRGETSPPRISRITDTFLGDNSNISKSTYPLIRIELNNGSELYEKIRISDHPQVSSNAPRTYQHDYRAKNLKAAIANTNLENDMQALANTAWENQKNALLDTFSGAEYAPIQDRETFQTGQESRQSLDPQNNEPARNVNTKNNISYSLTPADQTYLAAVKRGDMDTAQKMVDEEAKKAGYDIGPMFHGGNDGFDVFSFERMGEQGTSEGMGFYFTNIEQVASGYVKEQGGRLIRAWLKKGKRLNSKKITVTKAQIAKVLRKIDPRGDGFLSNYGDAEYNGYSKVMNDAVSNLFEYSNSDVDLISGVINSGVEPRQLYKFIEEVTGKSGMVTTTEDGGWGDDGHVITVITAPEYVKLADPVTYDEQGNIIPLSQRFDSTKESISYSLTYAGYTSIESAILARANQQTTEARKIYTRLRERLYSAVDKYERTRSGALTDQEKTFMGWRAKQPHTPAQAERLRLEQALAEINATLAALPPDLRATIKPPTARILDAETDLQANNAFHEFIQTIDDQIENHMREHYLEELRTALELATPELTSRRNLKSKLTAGTQRLIDQISTILETDPTTAENRLTEIENTIENLQTQIEDPATTPEEAAALTKQQITLATEYDLTTQFHNLTEKTSTELEQAYNTIQDIYNRGKYERKILDEDRRFQLRAWKQDILNSLNRPYGVTQAEYAKATDAQAKTYRQRAAATLKGLALDHMSFHDVMETLLPHSLAARDLQKRARAADRQVQRENIADQERFFAFMDKELGTTSLLTRMRKLKTLSTRTDTNILHHTATSHTTEKLTIQQAKDVLAGTHKPGWEKDPIAMQSLRNAYNEYRLLDSKRKARTKYIRFKRVKHRSPKTTLILSPLEQLYILQLADQPQYLPALDSAGYTPEVIQKLRHTLTPETAAIGRYLRTEYREGWHTINAVHQILHHMDMPQIRNYAPSIFKTLNEIVKGAASSPFGETMNTSLAAGFTQTRKAHRAAPRITNALAAYWSHKAQTTYWKAWAELAQDMRLILRDPKIMDAIETIHGTEGKAKILAWIEALETDGNLRANTLLTTDRLSSRIIESTSAIALAGNLMVPFKQISAAFSSMTYIPAGKAMKYLATALFRPSLLKNVWNSEAVQHRIKLGFSPEDQMVLNAAKHTATDTAVILSAAREHINLTDAAFTTLSAAAAYQYHYDTTAGDHATKHTAAMAYMDDVVARTAQPVSTQDLSLTELHAKGIAKLATLFKSDLRQKLGIIFATLMQGDKKKTARVIASQWILYGLANQLGTAIFRSFTYNDDEEDLADQWNTEDFLAAAVAGPISGLFLIGSVLEFIIKKTLGAKTYASTQNPLDKAAAGILADATAILEGKKQLADLTISDFRDLTSIAATVDMRAAAVFSAARTASQLADIGDTLYRDQEETRLAEIRHYQQTLAEQKKATADNLTKTLETLPTLPPAERDALLAADKTLAAAYKRAQTKTAQADWTPEEKAIHKLPKQKRLELIQILTRTMDTEEKTAYLHHLKTLGIID